MKVYSVTPNFKVWDSIKDIGVKNICLIFSTKELAEEYIKNNRNSCECPYCMNFILEIEVDKDLSNDI